MRKYTLRDIEKAIGPKKRFTSKQLIKARDQLKKVLKQALNQDEIIFKQFEHGTGICYNWRNAGFNWGMEFVEYISAAWKHTESPGKPFIFPVAHTSYRWEDRGLELRVDLMRYIIKRLNDMIRHRKQQEIDRGN